MPKPDSSTAIAGLTEGRIVHYVMSDLTVRAAIVVRVWRSRGKDEEVGIDEDGKVMLRKTWTLPDNGSCDLQVFLDGGNDAGLEEGAVSGNVLKTNVTYSPKPDYLEDAIPFTWHWPGRA